MDRTLFFENFEARWVTFARCLALCMLTVVFVGCRADLHCGCGHAVGLRSRGCGDLHADSRVRGLLCRVLCGCGPACCAHATANARGVSTGAVLVLVGTCPLLSDRAWGPDVQKTVVSTVAALYLVADVSACAVHRQGVDVPVSLQRRRLALGRATDSVHRLMVDIPVAARQWAFSKVYTR